MTRIEAHLLEHGLLVEGLGSAASSDGGVLIDTAGRIAWSGDMADLPELPSGIIRRDVGGAAILPGFIDCHVHLGNGAAERDALKSATLPQTYRTLQVLDALRKTLHAGVTTVRDLGGADTGIKMAVDQGLVAGPRMLVAITPIGPTGGHGDHCYPSGLDITGLSGIPSGIADGEVECRKKARAVLRAGADVLKVFSSGGVWSPRDQPDDDGLSESETRVVVEEARRHRGKRVASHAQGRSGIINAIRGGVASVEHGYQIDEEGIELMLERGTYLVPTLTTATTSPDRTLAPPYAYDKKLQWMEIAQACVPRAIAAGVRVAMGTDCGVVQHGRNLEELKLLVDFGLSPAQALRAGTVDAAELLGLSNDIGSLSPGKRADIVVAACDPLSDISSLSDARTIRLVLKDGHIVGPSDVPTEAPAAPDAVAYNR